MTVTVPHERIVDVIRGRFGLPEGRVRAYEGELDLNLRLSTVAGQDVLIKVSPPGTSPQLIAWQESLLAEVERYQQRSGPLCFEVPRLVLTTDGASAIDVDGHRVRVLTWVGGRLLSEVPGADAALLRDIGRVSAVLTSALEGLAPPEGVPEHAWLAERGHHSLRSALDTLPPSREVDLVEQVLAFHEEHRATYAQLPRSTVHQDLNEDNLFVAGPRPTRIKGVIDFNDAAHTIRVADVAIAASYAMRRGGAPLTNLVEVVRGYEAVRVLTEAERAVVFPIAITRLCINWAIWNSRAREQPTVYGQARSRTSWPFIEQIVGQDLHTAQEWVLEQLLRQSPTPGGDARDRGRPRS